MSILALVATGCSDKVVARGGGPGPEASLELPSGDVGDVPVELGPSHPDSVQPPNGMQREIVLLHDTTTPTQVTITQNLLIRAKVIDYSTAGPAANVAVFFAISENDNDGDASLTSNQSYTDDTGLVSVTFRAKTIPNVNYRVQLTCDGADPVWLDVYVAESPSGNIKVELQYEGPINVKNVHVRLFEGGYTCGMFNPINVPEGPLQEKIGMGLAESAEFKNLPESQKFTVVATALSPTDSLAAAGRLDGVLVLAEQTNTVTLTMYLLTLNPAGAYDAITTFDFTGAIPGTVGDVIDEIVTLFTNPGKFLIDRIKDLVKLYLGELLVDAAFSLFEDELASVITNWMLNESPEWLQDVFVVGQDLTQIVHALELHATLTITKLSNDFYVQGVFHWHGIGFYWHLYCDEGTPEYNPDWCPKLFSMEAFSDTEFPMDIIEGKFTGTIHDFDKLDVDNHTIKINYGKIIIFVLNEILIPYLTDDQADNLTDAILLFVNCDSIAAAIENGVLDAIGVEEEDIAEFCVDAITFVTKPVTLILGGLALDSQLRLTGKATLIDDDSDLKVDHIIGGEWKGHVEADGQEGPEFDGTWEAHKQ